MSLNRCVNGHMFSSNRYGAICPYCNSPIANGGFTPPKSPAEKPGIQETIGELEPFQPVVGWLVCTKGHSKGKDFRIVPERNFIGSDSDMDILINGDNHVAQRNHAEISYDPKSHDTLLIPGDSENVVYLNEKVLSSPKKLNSFDEIKLGRSKFRFISFCDQDRNWEDNWANLAEDF